MTSYHAYNNLPGIRATALKAGAVSMLHMHHHITEQPSTPPTPAMQLGSITHCAVLEPTRLPSMVVAFDGTRRGKAYDQCVLENPGKIVVKTAELEQVEHIATAVRRNERAALLLAGCDYEKTIQWTDDYYGASKCRCDAIRPGRLVELKTVSRIALRAVFAQAIALNYDIQVGWYLAGAQHSAYGDCSRDTWLIYVESSAPWDVLPVRVGQDVIDRGQKRAIEIARRYRECESAGVFPGVVDAQPETCWSLPMWALDEQLEGFPE